MTKYSVATQLNATEFTVIVGASQSTGKGLLIFMWPLMAYNLPPDARLGVAARKQDHTGSQTRAVFSPQSGSYGLLILMAKSCTHCYAASASW
jgi:hypothetical protein